MKMKKNPFKKNNIKAALIFYQNYEQKQKKNITKNIDSALIRSSKGFFFLFSPPRREKHRPEK